ncbi:MAG: L,D-transpeptidase [Pseudomonadota bacterium]
MPRCARHAAARRHLRFRYQARRLGYVRGDGCGHGTDAPWTIGQNVSKGCIRMHNDHVIELYRRVGVGTKVTATWKKFRPRGLQTARAGRSFAGGGSRAARDPNWARNVFGLN